MILGSGNISPGKKQHWSSAQDEVAQSEAKDAEDVEDVDDEEDVEDVDGDDEDMEDMEEEDMEKQQPRDDFSASTEVTHSLEPTLLNHTCSSLWPT